MWVRSLGGEDPLEKEMATHTSILARIISWTEEPGGLRFMGLQRVRQDLATKQQQMLMLFFMSKVHKIKDWVGKKSGFWRFQPEVKGYLADSVVDGLLLFQESCRNVRV